MSNLKKRLKIFPSSNITLGSRKFDVPLKILIILE